MDFITATDWNTLSLRNKLLDVHRLIRVKSRDLFQAGKLTLNEFQSISNDGQDLLNLITIINSALIDKVLTDIKNPAQEIIDATNNLQQAIDRLKSYQNFFDVLSRLVSLAGKIVIAIPTIATNPIGAIALIGTTIKDLNNLITKL